MRTLVGTGRPARASGVRLLPEAMAMVRKKDGVVRMLAQGALERGSLVGSGPQAPGKDDVGLWKYMLAYHPIRGQCCQILYRRAKYGVVVPYPEI